MSGSVRIGVAVLVGTGIILGALLVRSQSLAGESALEGLVVSVAPERQYIPPRDADGDGVEDWEEPYAVAGFDAISSSSSAPYGSAADSYTPPSTFTDTFSEAFFSDYISGKVSGDSVNTESIVENGVAAIENAARSKIYTKTDIVISESTTLRDYGNTVAAAILAQDTSRSEPEYDILKRALDTGDAAILDALIPIQNAYTNTLSITLKTPAPSTIVAEHLALLNAYSAISADIAAMRMVFEDPLYALARFKQYEDDATNLQRSFGALNAALRKAGVTYTDTEAGAFIQTLAL